MNQFESLVTKLIAKSSANPTISVNGISKKIKGMSRFATKNFPDGEYIKIAFEDHSLMLLVLGDQEIYVADGMIGETPGVTTEKMWEGENITYLGQEFEVVNNNDYQYVLQHYVGGIDDIEGECRFSDYAPIDGSKSMLSLAIISYTGKRADVCAKPIDANLVNVN